jgi:hypothetical protein
MARSKRAREPALEPEFPAEALDALIGSSRTPEELEALFRQMKKRIVERMLGGEGRRVLRVSTEGPDVLGWSGGGTDERFPRSDHPDQQVGATGWMT